MRPILNVVVANILATYAEITPVELPPFLAWILPTVSVIYSLAQLSVLVITQVEKIRKKRNAKRNRKARFKIYRPEETGPENAP